MTIITYTDINATDLRNNINDYGFCFKCGRTVKKSKGNCWFCQDDDIRDFPESMADSLTMMIEVTGDFNIHIGVTKIIT